MFSTNYQYLITYFIRLIFTPYLLCFLDKNGFSEFWKDPEFNSNENADTLKNITKLFDFKEISDNNLNNNANINGCRQ